MAAELIKLGYRGYTIHNSPYAHTDHRIQYHHDDYDGSEDPRCGTCKNVGDAQTYIDDLIQREEDGDLEFEKGDFY